MVVGADEVGRGAWAGPVAAAAVAFGQKVSKVGKVPKVPKASDTFDTSGTFDTFVRIDDSKKLTAGQRERAQEWIKENALCWGIGQTSVSEINRLGLGKANKVAFRRAVGECRERLQTTDYRLRKSRAVDSRLWTVDFLVIDAFYLPYTRGLRRKNQLAIINGDKKCFSIAAASILAKVWRDRLMRRLARKYPRYDWARNKGYGTKEHQKAIRKYGLTRLHRKQFVTKIT